MTGHRRKITVFLGAALIAATLALTGSGPASAGTVDVVCTGDDSVQTGNISSPNVAINSVIQTLEWATAPDKSTGIMALQGITEIGAGVSASPSTPSVAPGPGDITFMVGIEFGDSVDLPTDSMDLSDILFELTPASGVTGAPLQGTPPDVTIPFPPTGNTALPFTGSFDVTAPIAGEATWDLTAAELGIAFRIPGGTTIQVSGNPFTLPADAPIDVVLGLSCEAQSNPIVRAIVLAPPVEGGPTVPPREVTTAQGEPVDIDLLEGVEEGDAPTDPDSVRVLGEGPADGTVTIADGIATYTPDAGFTGEDQFAYEVCTITFGIDGLNQINHLVPESENDWLTLSVDGQVTEGISGNATAAEVQAAIEALSTVGAGNVVVTDNIDGGWTIEWVGDLARVAVAVAIDEAELDPTLTILQEAAPGEEATLCNSNVVTVTVEGASTTTTTSEPSTTTSTPQNTPAPPQQVAGNFTG